MTTSTSFARIRQRQNGPAFWVATQAPQRTFATDSCDVSDLTGRVPAGQRQSGCTWDSSGTSSGGQALAFNGTTAGTATFGSTLPFLTPSSPFSLSLWISSTSGPPSSDHACLLTNFTPAPYSGFALIWFGASGAGSFNELAHCLFFVGDNNSSQKQASTFSPLLITGTTWAFIVVTYDGSSVAFWINARPQAQATSSGCSSFFGSGAFGSTAGNLEMGYLGASSQFPYPGKTANLQIYNRVLSSREIAREYADPWWRFRDPNRLPEDWYTTIPAPSVPLPTILVVPPPAAYYLDRD